MTQPLQEACKLVLQAAAIGRNGQTLVLDMGEPIRIAEVAETLIAKSGRTDIEIAYTGLRESEKLVEVLSDDSEDPTPSACHDAVSVVTVPPLAIDTEQLAHLSNSEAAKQWVTLHSHY